MRKGQINIIMAIGMALVIVWALGRVFLYTSSIGTGSNIREEITRTIETNEKNRKILGQERQYALDRALLLTGIEGGQGVSNCGQMKTNNSFPFIPSLNGKINYWRDHDDFCVPKERQITNRTTRKLKSYLSTTIPNNLGVMGSLSTEFSLDLKRKEDGRVYRGTLEIPMFKKSYMVELFCNSSKVEDVAECPSNDRKVRFKNGISKEVGFQEELRIENRSIVPVHIQENKVELNSNKTNVKTGGWTWAACVEIEDEKVTFFANSSYAGYKYWYDEDPGCFKSLGENVRRLKVGDRVSIGEEEYQVESLHPTEYSPERQIANRIYLEPYHTKKLVLDKQIGRQPYIYYVPKRMTYSFPEADILTGQRGYGRINYKFIPSGDAELCNVGREKSGKLSSRICGSLLTDASRVGSLPLLYAYAEDYANGSYGGYRGYQNFAIDRWLNNQVDAVDMKTLKVMYNGEIKPKWGWKYNLISNLGLQGTKASFNTLNKNSCESVKIDNFWVEFCNEDNYESNTGASLDPILKRALKENFKDFFKQILIAKLNTLTNVRWNIGIRELNLSVTNTCKGETVKTHYETNYPSRYDKLNKTPPKTIGMPEQLRFGYKGDLEITPSHSDLLCKVNEYEGDQTGDPCIIDMEKIATCQKNAEIGVELECTQFNKCCPPGYSEQVKSSSKTKPCCKLLGFNNQCDEGPKDTRNLTYECYNRGGTEPNKYIVIESCLETQGPYGKVEQINKIS